MNLELFTLCLFSTAVRRSCGGGGQECTSEKWVRALEIKDRRIATTLSTPCCSWVRVTVTIAICQRVQLHSSANGLKQKRDCVDDNEDSDFDGCPLPSIVVFLHFLWCTLKIPFGRQGSTAKCRKCANGKSERILPAGGADANSCGRITHYRSEGTTPPANKLKLRSTCLDTLARDQKKTRAAAYQTRGSTFHHSRHPREYEGKNIFVITSSDPRCLSSVAAFVVFSLKTRLLYFNPGPNFRTSYV